MQICRLLLRDKILRRLQCAANLDNEGRPMIVAFLVLFVDVMKSQPGLFFISMALEHFHLNLGGWSVVEYQTVVTCKIKHLQNICKNVLVIYFTSNHRKTFAKHLQKCFRGGYV